MENPIDIQFSETNAKIEALHFEIFEKKTQVNNLIQCISFMNQRQSYTNQTELEVVRLQENILTLLLQIEALNERKIDLIGSQLSLLNLKLEEEFNAREYFI